MLKVALNRDMELLLRIFSVFDQKLTYYDVYLQYKDVNKHLKVFQTEIETLSRWLWKYEHTTLAHFKEYY